MKIFSQDKSWHIWQIFYEITVVSNSNKVLLIMFVVGIILITSATLMTFSVMSKDPAHNSLTMTLPMISGVVLLIISARIGLKKIVGFFSK